MQAVAPETNLGFLNDRPNSYFSIGISFNPFKMLLNTGSWYPIDDYGFGRTSTAITPVNDGKFTESGKCSEWILRTGAVC